MTDSETNPPDTKGQVSWTIKKIPKDTVDSRKLFHDVYRPFRLKMLKKSPGSFSSTLAREAAFTKDTWERRFIDPKALTFVALIRDGNETTCPQRIISALTLRGPFYPVPASDDLENDPRWEINAVYTDQEYRRMGIASAVLIEAIQHATLASKGRFKLKTGVMYGNEDANAFYEKVGFTDTREDHEGYDLARYFGQD